MSSLPGFVTRASSSPYSVGVRRTCSPSRVTSRFGRSTSSGPNRSRGTARLVGLRAPHRRPRSREQLLHAERLRDVVVGARVERRDLVGLRFAHRQHDHRHVAERAHPPDHLGAVDVGQPEVEQHQVGRLLGGADHAFLAGADRGDLVAVRLEARAQRAPDLRLVVDDQHQAHASASVATNRPVVSVGVDADRDLEHDAGAAAGGVLDPDAPAVRGDDRVRDREAEPACPGNRGSTRPVERLEDPLAVLGGDARALVAHPHRDAVAGARRPTSRTSPPGGRVPGGVLEQVRHDLVELHLVDRDRRHVVGDLEHHAARRRAAGAAARRPPRRSRRARPRGASGMSAPARIRARSRMLPTSRFSRSVSSRIVVSSSRSCSGSCSTLGSSRLVTPALIEASGVRKSWVTELNIAARSWFVSASSCASRARASSRARSSAAAACFDGRLEQQLLVRAERTAAARPLDPERAERDRADHERHDGVGPARRELRLLGSGVQLRAVELDAHLRRREPERLEQHPHEVVEHAVGHLARDELRREVAEQPRLALAPRRSSSLLGRAADEDARRRARPRGTPARRARPRCRRTAARNLGAP